MVRILLGLFLFLGMAAQAIALPRAVLLLDPAQGHQWHDLLEQSFVSAAEKYGFEPVVRDIQGDPGEVFEQAVVDSALVLVTSDAMHEVLRNKASNFRRVKFGVLDAGLRGSNIFSISFADEQASFLAGLAAAMLTEAGGRPGINPEPVIGWFSGEDVPPMRSMFNGFMEGARLARPDVRVIQALADRSADLAGEKVDRLLDAGADVIVLAGGAANPVALQRLQTRGARYIALDGPLPGSLPAGIIRRPLERAVEELVASAAGKFRGKEILVWDLADGVDFQIPEEVQNEFKKAAPQILRRVAEVKRELMQGNIRVPSLRERALCDCLD